MGSYALVQALRGLSYSPVFLLIPLDSAPFLALTRLTRATHSTNTGAIPKNKGERGRIRTFVRRTHVRKATRDGGSADAPD